MPPVDSDVELDWVVAAAVAVVEVAEEVAANAARKFFVVDSEVANKIAEVADAVSVAALLAAEVVEDVESPPKSASKSDFHPDPESELLRSSANSEKSSFTLFQMDPDRSVDVAVEEAAASEIVAEVALATAVVAVGS